MPVELRKRKAPAPPAPAPAQKKASKSKRAKPAEPRKKEVEKTAEAASPKAESPARAGGQVAVGETIDLQGFGGEVELNDGKKTTLKQLVEDSKAGVVLFTYPKASTPGCEYYWSLGRCGRCSPSGPSSRSYSCQMTRLTCISPSLSLSLLSYRHDPGLPLPRLLHTPDGRRPRYLRPELRLA